MNKKQNKKTKKYNIKGGVNNPIISNINSNNGFSATLIKNNMVQKQIKNANLCKMIIKNGKNTTKKNFMPSQFPKLTGLTQKYVSNDKKDNEKTMKLEKDKIEKDILDKARKDVKALKEQEERQQMYEKAVLQAHNELTNNTNK